MIAQPGRLRRLDRTDELNCGGDCRRESGEVELSPVLCQHLDPEKRSRGQLGDHGDGQQLRTADSPITASISVVAYSIALSMARRTSAASSGDVLAPTISSMRSEERRVGRATH